MTRFTPYRPLNGSYAQQVSCRASERDKFHLRPTVASIRGTMTVNNKGNLVAYESGLEKDFLQFCKAENQITSVIAQPFTLDFKDVLAGEMRKYTPDFLLTIDPNRNSTWKHPYGNSAKQRLIEIKPTAKLFKSRQSLLPKIAAARIWAKENNASFHVITDKLLNGPFFQNAKLLNSSNILENNPIIQKEMNDCIRGILGVTVGYIIRTFEERGFDPRAIRNTLFCQITVGEYWVDLYRPLNNNSMVRYEADSFPL